MGIISVERVLATPGLEVIFQGECRVRKEVVEEEFWGLRQLKERQKKTSSRREEGTRREF